MPNDKNYHLTLHQSILLIKFYENFDNKQDFIKGSIAKQLGVNEHSFLFRETFKILEQEEIIIESKIITYGKVKTYKFNKLNADKLMDLINNQKSLKSIFKYVLDTHHLVV